MFRIIIYYSAIPSYDTINKTASGDLYKYGSTPFRYISTLGFNGNVTLNQVTIYACEF